ncbi:MAG: hypoxanthine phosphoribosyltransferase [Clostridia bacterium]
MEIKELIRKEEIDKRLTGLASLIDEDYAGKEITAIVVLNGATFFAVNLSLKIKSKMKFEVIKISSYEGKESTGKINLKLDVEDSKIQGKDVLIIEDIIDTGRSMKYLLEHLENKNPKSLKVCALLSKPSRREIEVPIDYLGFEVPNKFVVGYGFDDEEGLNRNLPYIGYKE